MDSLIGFLKSGKKGNQNDQSPQVNLTPELKGSNYINSGRSKQKQSAKQAGIQQNLNNIFSYDENENIDLSKNPFQNKSKKTIEVVEHLEKLKNLEEQKKKVKSYETPIKKKPYKKKPYFKKKFFKKPAA